MEIVFNRILESFLLPPGVIFIMMVTGILMLRRFYHLGLVLSLGGFVLLLVLCLPITSRFALYVLESIPPLSSLDITNPSARAIVILGAGRYPNAPEYQGDTISSVTLERLRYGAYLQKLTKQPILVSGGSPYGEALTEAELMQQTLQDAFKAQAKWLEKHSHNTWENALYTQRILSVEGINTIFLLTHAWHMPRAKMSFEATGMEVIPAPMGFRSSKSNNTPFILGLIPNSDALNRSRLVLREYLGSVWYKLRYLG